MGKKLSYLSDRIKLLYCEGIFQKEPPRSEKARKISPLQSEYALANTEFLPHKGEHSCATMPYPSEREADRSLFGRDPPGLRSRPWTSSAAARVRKAGSSSRRHARPGSVRHLPGRKTSRTWHSEPWHTHPTQSARIWHSAPRTEAKESPNRAFCLRNARSYLPLKEATRSVGRV